MEFPDEIWQLVFNQLDIDSLKKCLLLSNDLRDLIIHTPRLMKKLKVIFYGETWREKIPFVHMYGACVKAVQFEDCGISHHRHITNILKLTPNIEELVFKGMYKADEDSEDILDSLSICFDGLFSDCEEDKPIIDDSVIEELDLQRLTALTIDCDESYNQFALKALKSCTKLKVLEKKFRYSEVEDEFSDFIASQNQLENFKIHGSFDSFSLSVFKESLKVNFKLKAFESDCDLSFNQNFYNFLLAQSSSLEEFLLSNTTDFCYYRLMLNNFHHLRKLSFCVYGALNEARIEEIKNLRLPSVTELIFSDTSDDAIVMRIFLGLFPNIEVLTINSLTFSLSGITENLPNLRKLDVYFCRIDLLMQVKSTSLKELEIANINPAMVGYYWDRIAEDFPNIERLIVHGIDICRMPLVVNADVAFLLQSLKNFHKIKYCEIYNDDDWSVSVIGDRGQDEPQNGSTMFRFVFDSNSNEKTTLSITPYFNVFHAQVVSEIVKDLKISEVKEISSP